MSENEFLCKVCDEGFSEYPNEIVICDKCELGYHQFCHEPSIPECVINYPDIPWICKKCFYQMSRKERFELCKKSQLNENDLEFFDKKKKKKKLRCNDLNINPKNGSNFYAIKNEFESAIKNQKFSSDDQINDHISVNKIQTKMCNKLPYDLNSLVWDEDHLANLNNIYCYCGKGVEHCRSMLQCYECRQWFHTICISSLSYELLIGDQYFKFVCSVCNQGEEICKRIIMKWSVAVGLALSNLTFGADKRFFDIEKDIIPFLIENESLFNLNTSLKNLNMIDLKDKIEVNLKSNNDKFICNDENNWSLNVTFPYEDPLTFTPFTTSCQSSLAKQNISFQNSSLNINKEVDLLNDDKKTNSIPIGACRKGASIIPVKPNKKILEEFRQINNINTKVKKKNEMSKKIKLSSVGGSSNNSSSTEDSFYSNNNIINNNKKICKNQNFKNNLNRKINNQIKKTNRKNNLHEEKNLLDLDAIIPYPENFEGQNNPFYCLSLNKINTFQEKKEIKNNNFENNFKNKKSKDSREYTSNFINTEYRIVSKDPKFPKLVFSRVCSSNENSFKNFNSNPNNFNNHTVCKNESNLDDFKILAQRITNKGKIEYMVECGEKA